MTTTFALMYTYTDDVALQDEHRSAHIDYLRRLVDDGLLVASGPWGPDDARGGLLVYRAEDRAAVQAIVDGDPFVTNGVVAEARIREWVPLLGPAAGALTSQA
ncbi:hypothetical protein CLV30_10820 [Haloactinopolyspora alba]|uniref:YCII-related domain-containing protein n=1 Tax=Haloactinopolyspora alba TaxID=648780 RepID=A0A2P8E0X3_9ACTN|nr:YciI family protein [Haloactinopolyspora alba]PSL03108.1 hypothetical protein CLV30_10820 [Haloactinopolyspora alba]